MKFASARKQKSLSVYVGVVGYSAMVITGEVMIGVWSKLLAESLRIAFYRETKAPDMALLSIFFITASLVTILRSLFS